MQPFSQPVTLSDDSQTKAVIAPELGGWLLRYARHLPGRGYVEAIYYDQAVVDRYPERMYTGNPLLFPLVSFNHLPGREHHYEWEGRTYPLPQHGFARKSKWQIASQTATRLTIEHTSSPETRAVYPFEFTHRITYAVVEGKLEFHQRIENRSDARMPFSTGIHPYFPVPVLKPASRNECFVELPACAKILPGEGWQSWKSQPFGPARLSLAEDFSGTMFFTDLAKPEVSLVDPTNRLRIRLELKDAPDHRFLALWSNAPDAPFFCIEPWTALPNSFRRRAGDLKLLEPQDTFEASMTLGLEEIVDPAA